MFGATRVLHDSSVVGVIAVSVHDLRVAFLLQDVEEVLPAAAPAPLPHAPAVVRGLINLRGEPLPLLDLRARLGLPSRPPETDDHVLVCRVAGRRVGVWVDRAEGIRSFEAADIAPLDEHPPGRHFSGAGMVEDGVLLVSDVRTFLSIEEASLLDRALAESQGGADDR